MIIFSSNATVWKKIIMNVWKDHDDNASDSDNNDDWFVFLIHLCVWLMHTYTLNFKCAYTKKCTYGLPECSEEGLKHNVRNSQPFPLDFVNVEAVFSQVTSFSFMDFISFELKEPWSNPLPADNLTHTYTHTHRLSVMDELFAVYWSTSFSHFIWIYHNKQTKKKYIYIYSFRN